jgi:hypothetical protein
VPRTLTMGGRGMPVGGGVSIDTFCAYIRIFLGPKNNISAEGGPPGVPRTLTIEGGGCRWSMEVPR